MTTTNLYDILNTSYSNKNDNGLTGFIKDRELSNHNQKVFYNPTDKKLLFNVAGTHNFKDVITDFRLATGGIKNTNRYKEARRVLNKAKDKYKPVNTSITGSSLGGTIAGYIANRNDKVYTFNKGATIGQKTRQNETAFRRKGDLVSLLNAGAKHTTSINGNGKSGILNAHSNSNLKNENIFV